MSSHREDIIVMAYIHGEGRGQGTLFPIVLDDLIASDNICRIIDLFVHRLDMRDLGFERSEAADTGRPGYDPRDLLKLYLYGYLNQIRSSRRLEAESKRNVELMWLLGRLSPDHKSISEFRRVHRDAITDAGTCLVRFAKECGLVRGEWIAIDGSKFQAVSNADTVRERVALERYLDAIDKEECGESLTVDPTAIQDAIKKLEQHPEIEASFMLSRGKIIPAYNAQTAVDSQNALIIAQKVVLDAADNRQLVPMVEASERILGSSSFRIVADAGYSNGKQAAECEAKGLELHIPAARAVHTSSGGFFYSREHFQYNSACDTYTCPAGKTLARKRTRPKELDIVYRASPEDCSGCHLKPHCTKAAQRSFCRHLYEDVLVRMQERATPDAMRLRRSTVEHPFATIKYRIFGHPRLLLRGLSGAQVEMSLATMAYNLKRMVATAGVHRLVKALG